MGWLPSPQASVCFTMHNNNNSNCECARVRPLFPLGQQSLIVCRFAYPCTTSGLSLFSSIDDCPKKPSLCPAADCV
jgi:hypothetical protein